MKLEEIVNRFTERYQLSPIDAEHCIEEALFLGAHLSKLARTLTGEKERYLKSLIGVVLKSKIKKEVLNAFLKIVSLSDRYFSGISGIRFSGLLGIDHYISMVILPVATVLGVKIPRPISGRKLKNMFPIFRHPERFYSVRLLEQSQRGCDWLAQLSELRVNHSDLYVTFMDQLFCIDWSLKEGQSEAIIADRLMKGVTLSSLFSGEVFPTCFGQGDSGRMGGPYFVYGPTIWAALAEYSRVK